MATDSHGMGIPLPPDATKLHQFPGVTRNAVEAIAAILAGGLTPAMLEAASTEAGNAVAGALNDALNGTLSRTLTDGIYPGPITPTVAAGAPVYAAPAKFGPAAMRGAVLNIAGKVPQPLTGRLTVETWAKLDTPPPALKVIFSVGAGPGTGGLWLAADAAGKLVFSAEGENPLTTAYTVADGAWHHIAVEFWSDAGYNKIIGLWVDGQYINAARTTIYTGWQNYVALGGLPNGTYQWTGALDSFRVSNVSRYTGSFAPPTAAPAWDESTLILAALDTSTVLAALPAGYPPRPAGARSGTVLYIGAAEPTDWLTNDRWIKKP